MIQFTPDLPPFAVERIKKLDQVIPHCKVISASRISNGELSSSGSVTRPDEIAVSLNIQFADGRVETLALAVHPEEDVRFPS
ncbi:MAG TPA: hypothetical protein DDW52_00935 [Planctomycetaceae bacterium]|nr:hypothetical protein [Planctomycetaceae bacterium]